MTGKASRSSINRTWLIVYTAVFIILAIILSRFRLTVPIGAINFGSTAVTVAAVLLPWPVGAIAGVFKGIGASFGSGSIFIELPAGIGDTLSAIFTSWLVKHWAKSYAIIVGQVSRYFLTGGVVAISLGILVAYGIISPGLAPIGNLTTSPWQNIVIIWRTVCHPAVTLSVIFNMTASLLIVWLFGHIIEKTLYEPKA